MTTRCAVLGDPIAHSLSPVLHRAAYAELGLDWTYEAIRVASGGLGDFLDGLDDSWRGLSLTMPLKRELVPLADELTATARLAAAANTLVLDDGRRVAHNTDVPGASAAIREHHAGPLGRATILGGGATATSVGLALADLGCTEITVMARSAERAEETLRLVAGHPAAPQVRYVDLAGPGDATDLLVSTIPAEAQDQALVERWRDAPVVFDVLYHPWPTPLAAAAQASGRTLVSGLDLLVHQAALQVALFTGHAVPVEVLRTAGNAALAG
ncbi:shikimate dehydrogenase [Nocardioides sp.]|uniref:shikimate dehydrogenase n=1 Tax=Nocardioides sp. TaxID=35761 RepID=UPI003D0D8B7C